MFVQLGNNTIITIHHIVRAEITPKAVYLYLTNGDRCGITLSEWEKIRETALTKWTYG